MTVSTSASEITLGGNASTTVFDFNFIAGGASNLVVVYTDQNGNQTTLQPTQYQVILNPPASGQLWGIGGTVTYPLSGSPINYGTTLTIQRILPLLQQTSISNQGNFYPQAVELALDNLCLEIQQVASRSGQFRGTWATGTTYNYADIVVDGVNGNNTTNWYMCIAANTSGVWSTDLASGDWTLIFNAQYFNPNYIAAGGDLTGNYPAPTIAKIQGTTITGTVGSGKVVLQSALQAIYPVGSLYFNASSAVNPNTLLGFGTWTAFGQGRVIVGVGTGTDSNSNTLTVTAGETSGEYTHTLIVGEMPAHSHTDSGHAHGLTGNSNNGFGRTGGGETGPTGSPAAVWADFNSETGSANIQNTGGGLAHNNIQPFIGVYIWVRTA